MQIKGPCWQSNGEDDHPDKQKRLVRDPEKRAREGVA
jgi:hypothetical protein